MALTIRKAVAKDVPAWLEILQITTGGYPDPQVFDPGWIQTQLHETKAPESETWVAEENGAIQSTISFLLPGGNPDNPVANLGRHLTRPEAYTNGGASTLITKAIELATERKQLAISRVLASDLALQQLYEEAGFIPVGFQPFKHAYRGRESVVFYSRLCGVDVHARVPIAETIPEIAELAQFVLGNFQIGVPAVGRDGVTGYPLQSEFEFIEIGRATSELQSQSNL